MARWLRLGSPLDIHLWNPSCATPRRAPARPPHALMGGHNAEPLHAAYDLATSGARFATSPGRRGVAGSRWQASGGQWAAGGGRRAMGRWAMGRRAIGSLRKSSRAECQLGFAVGFRCPPAIARRPGSSRVRLRCKRVLLHAPHCPPPHCPTPVARHLPHPPCPPPHCPTPHWPTAPTVQPPWPATPLPNAHSPPPTAQHPLPTAPCPPPLARLPEGQFPGSNWAAHQPASLVPGGGAKTTRQVQRDVNPIINSTVDITEVGDRATAWLRVSVFFGDFSFHRSSGYRIKLFARREHLCFS